MSDTESEEFESADEEFLESPKKSIDLKAKHESTKDDKQENNPKLEPISKKGVENNQEKPDADLERLKLESHNVDSDLGVNPEDGWDVDGWETDSSNQINTSVKKENDLKTASNENDEAEGGWSDFDDNWDDSPAKPTPKLDDSSSNNMNSVFPILGQMSPDKQPKKPEGILKNLSKFVNKSDFVVSHDAFPVLNELSPTKKHEASFVPNEEQQSNSQNVAASEPQQTIPPSQSSTSWGGWGGMMSTILSTATEGVTSLTSQVSQGLSSVLETGIGVPDPEEMARINKQQESRLKELEGEGGDKQSPAQQHEETLLPSLGNIMSGVTHIGNKVITGGLDTLEGIGKKTMTILQENDPLLLNKRKFLGLESEKPVLSQVLREAKEKSEEIERNLKQMHRNSYKKQLHFESLFDHYYGLVHLEALEMLSKQSSIKLQSLLEPLTGKALADLQETLNEVKELCDLGELESDDNDGLYSPEELTEKLSTAIEDLGEQTDFKDIIKCWKDNVEWLTENPNAEAQEVYEKGLHCLAETCALAIHKYHKIAEILLIKDHHSTANEADSLVQLTTSFCWHLSGIANRFGGKLNTFEQNEEISSLITSIFVEVYNSNSYIQSAFQLFIPILQIGAA